MIMNHMNNRVLGREGENLAVEYLIDRDYKIVKRNWTSRWCELDIIAEKDGFIVFVEVKYRTNPKYGSGLEAVDLKKIKALLKSISVYINNNKLYKRKWRLDVLVIDIKEAGPEILYIRNATEHFVSIPKRVQYC